MSDHRQAYAAACAGADDACHGALRELGANLDAQVWVPMLEAVQVALDAHGEAVRECRLTEPCPEDPNVARERAVQYVTLVAEGVQAPLLAALRRATPVAKIDSVFAHAERLTRAQCGKLPVDLSTPRSPDDLVAGLYDGAGRRAGRRVARLLSAVGVGRGPRKVKARAVAQRHQALHLTRGQARWRDEALRRWAMWLGGLEAGWAAWVSPLLPSMAGTSGATDSPATDVWETLTSAAAALQQSLEEASESPPHAVLVPGMEADLKRWEGLLASDLAVTGTFLLNPRPRDADGVGRGDGEWWSRWQDQALGRLEMHRALLNVFVTGCRVSEELRGRVEGEALTPWQGRVDACAQALRECASELRAAATISPARLEEARKATEAVLADANAGCPDKPALESLARRAAGLAIGSVQSGLRTVPDVVEVHTLAVGPPRRSAESTHALPLQEMARQAFDALRMERIRKAPGAIVATVETMRASLAEVSEIVQFGLDAGATELEGSEEGAGERARELVAEALERAAAAAVEIPVPLSAAIGEGRVVVDQELMAGFGGLASRALAHRVHGQILDARTWLAGVLRSARDRAGPRFERQLQRTKVQWLRLRRAAARLLRRGRSIMGTEGAEPGAAARTARTLAAADEMVEALPLVYQHLFSAEPVVDRALLAGRDVELAEVETRWHRWGAGKGIPLLIIGRRGCGISSFFRVLVSELQDDDVGVEHRVLDQRVSDESQLAAYLCDIFGFDDEVSLDGLAARILESPDDAVPDIVAVEGLEHVYLRVPGGTDLLERLFTLMAETEPRVFWIGSITSSAWQVVKKGEPAAASQMDCLDLSVLPATDLQSALMNRHRRSGLRLTFEEPAEGRRILRRRLRRLRGTDRHQEVLRDDYFERLHRSAHGNLRLALFQWLRSVDFSGADGELVVHPMAGLDWSFLDSLDLTQNFTLKAFLEHQTLTLAEHDAVFRATRQESYHTFESLVNRQIIEIVPTATEDEEQTVSRVLDETRYRIRPLLTGAVAMHLASLNIVH